MPPTPPVGWYDCQINNFYFSYITFSGYKNIDDQQDHNKRKGFPLG
jgi:hypothetical protein